MLEMFGTHVATTEKIPYAPELRGIAKKSTFSKRNASSVKVFMFYWLGEGHKGATSFRFTYLALGWAGERKYIYENPKGPFNTFYIV